MSESKPSWRARQPETHYRRITAAFYVFAGIVNPLLCFGCAAPAGSWAADEPWKSGEFWVYATLMLKWPAVLPFYPLLLYSMASLGVLLWDRPRFVQHFWVRLGVYGGIVLSLIFACLLYAPSEAPVESPVVAAIALILAAFGTFAAAAIFAAFATGCFAAVKPLKERFGGWPGLLIVAGAVLTLGFTTAWLLEIEPAKQALAAIVFLPLIVCLLAGPAWSTLAYLMAARQLLVRPESPPWRLSLREALGATAWIACLLGAWRKAMDLAIAEYATLPAENPNCFICSAAAHGHARFVGSESIAGRGKHFPVTRQLRILKAAELALQICMPAVHRAIRRVYDRWGPPAAQRLKNPWLADAAYVALKPAEWMASLVLRVAFSVGDAEIGRLYSPPAD